MDPVHNEQKREKGSQKVLRPLRGENVSKNEKLPEERRANKEIINFINI